MVPISDVGVAGDFNQANMKTLFHHFQQDVDFATRGENNAGPTATSKRLSRQHRRPHLGFSDHLSVMLIPAYKPLIIGGGGGNHCVAGGGLACRSHGSTAGEF